MTRAGDDDDVLIEVNGEAITASRINQMIMQSHGSNSMADSGNDLMMRLLDFVALYGLILMPMGAVIFVDFWLIRRLGLKSNYAQWSKQNFNWAAGLTWFVTFGVCLALVFSGIPAFQIYFVSLPGWFIAAVIYIVGSRLLQRSGDAAPVAS